MTSVQTSSPATIERAIVDILVVEDDVAFRGLIEGFLVRAGYTVRVAASGRAAKKLLARITPRLVITDIFMPESDGIELLTTLRQTHIGLAIIAMSGTAADDLELVFKIARHLGAQRTLMKPFPLQELRAAVEASIGPPWCAPLCPFP